MKRLVLVLVVFVLVAAPLVAGIWTLIVPKYEARAEVRVRPIIPRLVFRTEDNGAIPFYESFVNTQVSIIRSQTVLQRALDQPAVQKTQWYKSPTKTLRQRWTGELVPALERLRNGLSVEPRPQTEIIDVSFADPTAKDAMLTVDAVLQQYLLYIGQQSNETEDKLYRELTSQYNTLEAEIKARESTRAILCKQLGTEAPQELIARRRVRTDETEARLNELRNRVALLAWKMKEADGNSPAGPSERQPKYHEDAEWRKLDLDVRMAQHQIDKSLLTPNSPERIGLTKDLEFAKGLRLLREQQLDERWNDQRKNRAGQEGGPVSVEQQLALARTEERLLSADLERQKADFDDLFIRAQTLEREDTELRRKRELYDAVRQRLDQKNIERNVPSTISIMPAYCPSKPSQDPRILSTTGATLLGLCVAGGTAVLTRRRTKQPSQE